MAFLLQPNQSGKNWRITQARRRKPRLSNITACPLQETLSHVTVRKIPQITKNPHHLRMLE